MDNLTWISTSGQRIARRKEKKKDKSFVMGHVAGVLVLAFFLIGAEGADQKK
jgi:hypothetical protein